MVPPGSGPDTSPPRRAGGRGAAWRKLSAQRKSDRNGEILLRLRHARRERRQRLRMLKHRKHFGVEIGIAGAGHDLPRQHVAVAVDGEAEHHDALLIARPRATRIALETLQLLEEERRP